MAENGAPMSKVQKSLMVQEDLYRLIQAMEEKGGATFTRIVTAALLGYFFEPFNNPEKGKPKEPSFIWMRLAVLLERGEVRVPDLPMELLDETIDFHEKWIPLKEGDREPNVEKIEALRETLKMVKEIRRDWKADVEEFGGGVEALIEVIRRK